MYYFLLIIFDIFLFQSCISRIFPPIILFEEILTIVLLFLLIHAFLGSYKTISLLTIKEKKLLILIVLFLVEGIISSILNGYKIESIAIFKDILATFKIFLSYYASLIIFEKVDKDKLLTTISKKSRIYIIVIFIGCILNLFVDIGLGHGIRYGFRCYQFLFTHPTYLVFAMIALICVLTAEGRKKNQNYIIQAIIILIFTFRSKAFVFILIYGLINIYLRFSYKIKVKHLIIMGVIGGLITSTKIVDYFSHGLSAARPALYIVGLKIMEDYFPFGSGFGTFGTSISGEYYSPVYVKYGISNVTGLTSYDYTYIADTFWPFIYGQFGFIGFVLYILILLYIYKSLLCRYSYATHKIKAVNLLVFYLLFASTAEAIFIDVSGQFALIILAIFLGNNKGYLDNPNS